MDLISLIKKIRTGTSLSKEEREHLLILVNTELKTMKERDPKTYLDLLDLILDAVRRASRQLATIGK